ncbi:MAG: M48 family metallopeptidase, partial [Pseudomonadota bacterium]
QNGVTLLTDETTVWTAEDMREQWLNQGRYDVSYLAGHFSHLGSVSEQLGQTTLAKLDQVLEPSELPKETQQQVRELLGQYAQVETIALRKAESVGPNAFTLSATTVVVTDELVELLTPDELVAVFWHEVGHAKLKHVERNILQSSAWVVLLTMISGDATGAAELVLTLPVMVGQMAYSREMELEADSFAVGALSQSDVSPLALASALEKLEAFHRSEGEDEETEDAAETVDDTPPPAEDDDGFARRLLEYFSTHPATEERIEEIERNAAIWEVF